MFDNPHSFSLSRIRFVNPDGSVLDESILDTAESVCDLWNGVLVSVFVYNGVPVKVMTCVHPERDAVTVNVETDAELAVMLDFGYPSIKNGPGMGTISKSNGWNADYDDPDPHYTSSLDTKITSVIARIVDETEYCAAWRWSNGTMTTPSMHERLLKFTGNTEFTVEYYHGGGNITAHLLPLFDETSAAISRGFSEDFKKQAELLGCSFFDAASCTEPDPKDGVHITAESHSKLGRAIAEKILEII